MAKKKHFIIHKPIPAQCIPHIMLWYLRQIQGCLTKLWQILQPNDRKTINTMRKRGHSFFTTQSCGRLLWWFHVILSKHCCKQDKQKGRISNNLASHHMNEAKALLEFWQACTAGSKQPKLAFFLLKSNKHREVIYCDFRKHLNTNTVIWYTQCILRVDFCMVIYKDPEGKCTN